jgi:hypothetical protein
MLVSGGHYQIRAAAQRFDRLNAAAIIEILLPRLYKQVIAFVTKNLVAVLKESDEPIPDERDLRRVVRKLLRHIRRERAPVTVKDVLSPTAEGKSYLGLFVSGGCAIFNSSAGKRCSTRELILTSQAFSRAKGLHSLRRSGYSLGPMT